MSNCTATTLNEIDVLISETVESLLDMVEERAGVEDYLKDEFDSIVGAAIEKWGYHVMRKELARCNAVLSVFEANVKHLDVAPHWTTARCGDRWLVYYDNCAVTLDESEPPNYRTFGYASEAVEWILGEGIKYPSSNIQTQSQAENDAPSNDRQIKKEAK